MGNQGHTTNGVREIKEWYEAGVLGEVKEVHGWIGEFNLDRVIIGQNLNHFPPKHEIPDHLDWNLWLGPENIEILIQLMHLSHGEGFMILVMDN